jgi:hypothetical protein
MTGNVPEKEKGYSKNSFKGIFKNHIMKNVNEL